jgi:hypothetical protein
MITNTMVHQGKKCQTLKKNYHVNELLSFEKFVGFSENRLTVQYKARSPLRL